MTNMELTEHSSQSQIDEKAVAHIAHKNNSDPNCSHLENVTPNNEADEALESEVKYPVSRIVLESDALEKSFDRPLLAFR
jgi:hypothetical protein